MTVTRETIMSALEQVPDPEMPVSIVELGLVERVDVRHAHDRVAVSIDILPTFVGCPALSMIEDDIKAKVGAVTGVGGAEGVEVHFINDPPWSVDRISTSGRERLKQFGVTVPDGSCGTGTVGHAAGTAVGLRTSAIRCPYCDSDNTRMESAFGPTRCRMIYYCDACKNQFEHMKRV